MDAHLSNRRTVARIAKSLFMAKSQTIPPVAFAEAQPWIDKWRVIDAITKSAVQEVDLDAAAGFVESDLLVALRPVTAIDRLLALGARRVPRRVRLIAGGSGAVAYWAGNGRPIPLSSTALTGSTMNTKVVAALVLATNESLASADPATEDLLGRDLVNALAQAIDAALLDPTNVGSDETPAAITGGVTATTSTGSTLSQVDADLQAVIQALIDTGSNLQLAAWIMRPRTATYLAGLRGTGGAAAFPQMGAAGGVLLGLPAITTANVPEAGSPAQSSITLLDVDDLAVADGDARVVTSSVTAVEMATDPTGDTVTPTGASHQLVSLFQAEASALKATRDINWALRTGRVAVLDGVSY